MAREKFSKGELLLLVVGLAVVVLIAADGIASIPLRELGMFECYYETSRDICAFDWRRFGETAANVGLGIVATIFACNARHLKTMNEVNPK